MSEFEKLNEEVKIDETTSDAANNNVVKEVDDELTEATSTKGTNESDEVPPGRDKKINEAGESTVVKTSQRKLRLNRRGFHLANSPTANLEIKDAAEKPSDINGNNDSVAKTKCEVPKKVISLRSVKKNLPEQTLAPVKRKFDKITYGSDKKEGIASAKTESSETSENSSPKDSSAQKKHKPITWP